VTANRGEGVFEARGLTIGYGTTFVMQDLSFQVERGAVVGLIGPNGSGKSTLLKALAGVIPVRRGEVLLGGRPIDRGSGAIAFVPQREEVNWDFPVTARNVVMMGRYRERGWLRWPGGGDRRRADEALARMGLEGMGDRHISQFSGGQQQRIFLARALVQEPRIVLLDEPLTGVDAENRAVFYETIRSFAANDVTVLMATHEMEEVPRLCSHVCCMNHGIVAFGPTKETYTPKTLRRTFGGQMAVFG
jgi:manganese/zinc/iron transport system ATP- binding protein